MATFNIIVILGPTASGKTALAVDMAQVLDTEIISADSRQVYKGMDIGTGKDLEEYQNVPYHLINIREAGEKYNVADFQKDFHKAFQSIQSKQKIPIICGGTGMYIEAVLKDFQNTRIPEDSALRLQLSEMSREDLLLLAKNMVFPSNTDLSTNKRIIRALEIQHYLQTNPNFDSHIVSPQLKPFIIGINPPLDTRRDYIESRLQKRLQNGLIEEVRQLLQKGVPNETLEYYGLEYKYVSFYLRGLLSYDEMYSKLLVAIHQYAKRQMTFFRSMERKGLKINWIDF